MGGSFSNETNQWSLASDEVLRTRFVKAVRSLFPAYQSFQVLDDELSFSLLDVEGSGLINEVALANLVKRCGFKMERWQLLYLLHRLDSDGDGLVGFADFILFMHGEDPNVAAKRGISGSRALNVALTNTHLRGDNVRAAGGDGAANELANPEDEGGAPGVASARTQRPRARTAGLDTRRSMVSSFMASEALPKAKHHLSYADRRYLRRHKGHFSGFDQYRNTRVTAMANLSAGTALEELFTLGPDDGGGGSRKVRATPPSMATLGGDDGPPKAPTLRGFQVASAAHPYAADTIQAQAADHHEKARSREQERLFEYVGESFNEMDRNRAERLLRTFRAREEMDERGRQITGRAVVWRTDAGAPGGDMAKLVPSGPRYWDPDREHLHLEAFSSPPPAPGKPRVVANRSGLLSEDDRASDARWLSRGASDDLVGVFDNLQLTDDGFASGGRAGGGRPSTTGGLMGRSLGHGREAEDEAGSFSSSFAASQPSPIKSAGRGPSYSHLSASSVASSSAVRARHRISKSTAPKSPVYRDAQPAHLRTSRPAHHERRGASRALMAHHHI